MARNSSTTKSPQDITGAKDEALRKDVAEKAITDAAEAETARQAKVAELEEIEDLTEELEVELEDDTPSSAITLLGSLFKEDTLPEDDELDFDDEQEDIEGTRVIRVAVDLEDVTIGAGNQYTFRRGKKYKVPKHVADHLEEKGLLWGQY